jgi:hypothetical protein
MKFAAIVSSLLLVTSACALEWKTQSLSVKAAPLQRHAETAFEFVNRGDKPVTITSVDTSCDCLEATPSARTIAPGASGTINARFTVGDRFGAYRRTIIVSTDEGQEPVALSVELEVPEIATVSPRSVEWKLNGSTAEQVIEINVADGIDLNVVGVQSTSEAFTFRLEPVQAGKRYRLYLAPKATDAVANAAFRLIAKTRDGRDLIFSAYGNVR